MHIYINDDCRHAAKLEKVRVLAEKEKARVNKIAEDVEKKKNQK